MWPSVFDDVKDIKQTMVQAQLARWTLVGCSANKDIEHL
jgi:hypothetical protein